MLEAVILRLPIRLLLITSYVSHKSNLRFKASKLKMTERWAEQNMKVTKKLLTKGQLPKIPTAPI